MKVLLLLLCLAVPAQAEQAYGWRTHRPLAEAASNAALTAALSLDTLHALRSESRWSALGCEGLRLGLVLGATEIVKRAVQRPRPDGSDHLSFWSGHTATAMSTARWRYQVGIPLTVGVGYLRIAADRHYVSDVLAGAGMGWLVSRVCQ